MTDTEISMIAFIVSFIIGFIIWMTREYIKDMKSKKKENENEIHEPQSEHGRKQVLLELKNEVWKRDKFKCQYCGKDNKEVDLGIEYIIPESKGGMTVKSNLQTLCVECNREKSDK